MAFFSLRPTCELNVEREMNKKTIFMVFLVGAINTLTSACVPIPQFTMADRYRPNPTLATSEMDEQAKKMVAPADKALVYLYRNEDAYEHYDATIYLDNESVVEIAAGTYLLWQLTPGIHIVESGPEKVSLHAKAGEKYYIRIEVTHFALLGMWRDRLQIMEKEEGQKGVEDSRLMIETPEW